MTFQKEIVSEKLNRIDSYLAEVKLSLQISAKDILNNTEKLRFLERNFQLIVDEIIDINQYFIKELGLDISNDLEGTFQVLSDNKILPEDFALKVAPIVGLRNRLVHRYEKVEPRIFIESFQKGYSDFEEYIKLIISYSEKEKL
ncbi:MAG: DUF86 domain-containing protein [Patescibacteria group bacterium]